MNKLIKINCDGVFWVQFEPTLKILPFSQDVIFHLFWHISGLFDTKYQMSICDICITTVTKNTVFQEYVFNNSLNFIYMNMTTICHTGHRLCPAPSPTSPSSSYHQEWAPASSLSSSNTSWCSPATHEVSCGNLPSW